MPLNNVIRIDDVARITHNASQAAVGQAQPTLAFGSFNMDEKSGDLNSPSAKNVMAYKLKYVGKRAPSVSTNRRPTLM